MSGYCAQTNSANYSSSDTKDNVLLIKASVETVEGTSEITSGIISALPGLPIAADGVALMTSVVGFVPGILTVAAGVGMPLAIIIKGVFDTLEGLEDFNNYFTGRKSPSYNPLDTGPVGLDF